MELHTKRLMIRDADKETADKVSELAEEPHVAELFRTLPKEKLMEMAERLDDVISVLSRMADVNTCQNKEYYGAWDNSELVGYIAVVACEEKTAEIQIEIVPEYQHKGYGHEFLSALLDHLFKEQSYEQFRYAVLPNNKASIALVEKLGGILQEAKSKAEEVMMKTYYIKNHS